MPEATRKRYLVDNSVWQRQAQPAVRAAVDRLRARYGSSALLVCPPVAAEVGFSARNGTDHSVVVRALRAFPQCEVHPGVETVLTVQNALFNGGFFRAVGAIDTVIAAYAIANEATVLHYDRDFEFVGRVTPELMHTWVAPAGSLDR